MFFDFRKAARPAPAHTSLKAAEAAQKSLAELFTSLDSCSDGLQESQAVARLETEGRNDVARERVPNVMVQLAGAFNNPFIYVLLLISAVSFYSDYWLPLGAGEETDGTSAAIVLFMVLLSLSAWLFDSWSMISTPMISAVLNRIRAVSGRR